jgi:asparagine synthase (glutamine-hydrolysing)
VCGIAGSLGYPELDQATVSSLLDRLSHRGPDGRSVRAFDGATLMHTRLRIIDLSAAGDQPMANEDGDVWVVGNGEIYNHKAIRSELEASGHVFHGHCDAEVLPHLYEELGDRMFERLRGMFAIAVLDVRQRRLLLARDRYGIKPLVYAAEDGRITFASEIRALRAVAGVDLRLDLQSIADYASLLYIPSPATIHTGIRSLEPGAALDCRLGSDGRVSARRFRFHEFRIRPNDELTLEEAAERADALVADAVASQLESDVPLASLLSGGIDSSLVSFFAQRSLDRPIRTFNVEFADPAYDETEAALAVAAAIGSDHLSLALDDAGSSTFESVTKLLAHVGQPFADSSLFAVDAISKAIRSHVTVALSGDGGDEGFGGYNVYWRVEAMERLHRIPYALRRVAGPLLSPLAHLPRFSANLPRRLRTLGVADDARLMEGLFAWLDEHQRNSLLLDPGSVEPTSRLFESRWAHELPADASRLARLSAHAVEINIRLLLANDFLPKVDAASMRNSLEVRVPLLDEDLFDFALTLPHELRVQGRTGKRVLRRVAADHLPADVVGRPKQGFAVPVDRWLGDGFRDDLREALLSPSSPLAAVFEASQYRPWVEAFCDRRPLASLSRSALYQRVVMLLSLHTVLSDVS